MRNINPFVIKTLILCIVLFSLTTLAHSLALMVKDSSYAAGNETYPTGTAGRQDNTTGKSWNISTIANNVGAILLGMDMPMPLPIIVSLWNTILLILIAYDVSEVIKAWIPLL